jgi:hypothetical protein
MPNHDPFWEIPAQEDIYTLLKYFHICYDEIILITKFYYYVSNMRCEEMDFGDNGGVVVVIQPFPARRANPCRPAGSGDRATNG